MNNHKKNIDKANEDTNTHTRKCKSTLLTAIATKAFSIAWLITGLTLKFDIDY